MRFEGEAFALPFKVFWLSSAAPLAGSLAGRLDPSGASAPDHDSHKG